MARSRNIKPGFFTNEDLVELDFATRLLFVGLWTVADRDGRLQDRPKKIKIDVFPADNLDIDVMLTALHKGGFINRYEVNGGKFIQITNWTKHQNPHHTEKASDIPAINSELTGKAPLEPEPTQKQDGECLADSLIPDSRFTDSLIPDAPTPSAHDAPTACATEPAKVCLVMKAVGIPDVNPGHPDLLMLLEAGATVAEFEGAARTASGKGKGFAYALGTLKRTRQDAAKAAPTLHSGPLPTVHRSQPKTFAQQDREDAMARWEEQTNRVHPDRIKAQQGQVIDVTPGNLEIAQ